MDDKKFIELAKKFLNYSFYECDGDYNELTDIEKTFLTKEEFELLLIKINDNK